MKLTTSKDSVHLAAYAMRVEASQGRQHAELEARYRTAFQRDRDRIIHSRAFRRLEYKTQVFVNHEGDHYRTRLTHSIEVCQVGRTVARTLSLNEDLVECLALSHDLGHAPFGHQGEDILAEKLKDHGGFDHNLQTLRIVEHLEDRYPTFPGLNLTWEVREGIAKHSASIDVKRHPELAVYAPELFPTLEAQLLDLVDEIAYNHHDIDDGLESGLLDERQLADAVPLFGRPFEAASRKFDIDGRQLRAEALRGVIDRLVSDLIETTQQKIDRAGIDSTEAVARAGCSLVGLSTQVAEENRVLKEYLRRNLYEHHHIERMMVKARRILSDLFDSYQANPRILPDMVRSRVEATGSGGAESLERAIADYIAGMTDRYAIDEHRRLFDPQVRV
jgi:dGTPase